MVRWGSEYCLPAVNGVGDGGAGEYPGTTARSHQAERGAPKNAPRQPAATDGGELLVAQGVDRVEPGRPLGLSLIHI